MNSKKAIPATVIALGVTSLLTDAATEMIYPLIPIFIAALGSGAIVLGVIEGVAETTAAMLKLFSGIWSDKLGKRKPLVVLGYTISTLMRPFTAVVSSAWQIVFIRMVDRVGKGIRTSPRDALIASSTPIEIRGKAFGFHRAMDHSGAVVGPLLALLALMILVLSFNLSDSTNALRWIFALSIIPGGLAVLTLIFFVKEPVIENKSDKTFKFSLKQFDGNFKIYLVTLVIFTLGNSSDAFLLFRVQEFISSSGALFSIVMNIPLFGNMVHSFGDAETQKNVVSILFLSIIWAFFHIIKAVFSTPLGSLSDKIGRKWVINIGWGIYAIVYLSFAFIDALPANLQVLATFVLFAVYALFYAFTEGVEKAFVADLVSPEIRGSAYGLYNFAIGLGALPASILFGILYHSFGASVAFISGAAFALVAIILLLFFVKEARNIV